MSRDISRARLIVARRCLSGNGIVIEKRNRWAKNAAILMLMKARQQARQLDWLSEMSPGSRSSSKTRCHRRRASCKFDARFHCNFFGFLSHTVTMATFNTHVIQCTFLHTCSKCTHIITFFRRRCHSWWKSRARGHCAPMAPHLRQLHVQDFNGTSHTQSGRHWAHLGLVWHCVVCVCEKRYPIWRGRSAFHRISSTHSARSAKLFY